MAMPGKATKKEKKKPVPVKTSLNNPYNFMWKPLEKGDARFILKTVTEKLGSLDLRKQDVKVFRKWGNKRRKARKGKSDSVESAEPTHESHNRGVSDSVDNAEPTQESRNRGVLDTVDSAEPTQESRNRGVSDSLDSAEPTQESRNRGVLDSLDSAEPTQESRNRCVLDSVDSAEPTQESRNRGWTNKELRSELAIGINEVTKGLEKNELGLVLVCDSVRPPHMTNHLISLSQTRSVPACQVPGLSAAVAGSLGLTSVLALGFRRQSEVFGDTIRALSSKVPPLDVFWLPKRSEASKVDVEETEQHQQIEGKEPEGGRKRKLEDSPEVKKDQVTSLQPLKVKKIIPNPSKTRKLKMKKGKK